MPPGRVLDITASNIAEVASLGNVASNAYIRLFDQNSRTGKAVAFGVRDMAVTLYNISTGSNQNAMRFGVGLSNPNTAAMLHVNGLVMGTSFVGNIDGSNIASGTLPNARLPTSGVAASTLGDASNIPRIQVDVYGRVVALTAQTPSLPGSAISSGTLNVLRFPTSGVTAGAYGRSNVIPAITVDTYGRVTAVTATNVAIDTTAITSGTLSVLRGGTGFSSWNAYQIPYGTVTNVLETSALFNYTNGMVGIGTTSPIAALHVTGDAYISGTVNCSNVSFFSSNGSFNNIDVTTTTSQQLIASNMGTGPALFVVQGGAQPLADFVDYESGIAVRIANNGNTGFGTSNVNARVHIFSSNTIFDPLLIVPEGKPLIMKNNGTVGIGTIGPDNTKSLHVFGAARIDSNLDVNEELTVQKNVYTPLGGVGIGTTARRGAATDNLVDIVTTAARAGLQVADSTDSNVGVRLVSGTGVGASTTTYCGALDVSHGLALYCRNDGQVRNVFDTRTGNQYNAGSLGLGVLTASAKLDVDGDIRTTSNITAGTYLSAAAGSVAAPGIRVGGAGVMNGLYTSNGSLDLGLVTGGTERIRIGSNGTVAMGKQLLTSPTSELHIQGSNTSTTVPAPRLQLHNVTDTGGAVSLDFCTIRTSGGANTPMAQVLGATNSGGTSADMIFSTRNTGNAALLDERMRLTGGGQLGIGTATPQANVTLHVNGRTRMDDALYMADAQGYSWVSDTTTYLNRPAAGTLALTCAGTERFRLDGSNAGFFTNNPTGFQVNALANIGPGGTAGSDSGFSGGPFVRQGNWTAAGTTHTISIADVCGDNSAGTIYLQAIFKNVSTGGKAATAMLSYVKFFGLPLDTFLVYLHKGSYMTTFNVTADTNNIVVTTDAGCRVCWSAIGAY